MTIKNTKKNISAENEYIITKVANTAPTKDNNVSNFKTDQKIKFTKEKFYKDGDKESATALTATIPLTELVRLGYLENNYYTKDYIDAHIKLHYEILQSMPNMTNKQWAESVRSAQKQNYIFLVPFSTNYEGDNNSETDQDGFFMEYFYYVDENDSTYASEKMERIGSTKINLTAYLETANLNSELLNANNFTNLKSQSDTNKNNITALETSKVNVHQSTASGILVTNGNGDVVTASNIDKSKIAGFSNSNEILITDSNNKISTSETLLSDKIINEDPLGSINSQANVTQSTINGLINSKIGTIQSNMNNYELKSDLREDVWGESGFASLQDMEPNDSAYKDVALGDYIYQHLYNNFYTKSEIDWLIGSLDVLQLSTLNIL